jgi:hypothetical protein
MENPFGEEDAVALGRRTDKVFRAIMNEIAGWTPQLRDRKIDQLASVIAFFHVVMRRHATREIVQVNFKTTTSAARTWVRLVEPGR